MGLDGLGALQFVPDLTLLIAEVESFRTSLVSRTYSRTHFKVLGLKAQVLGLGHEAYKSSKMLRPRLQDSIISWLDEKENT